MKKQPALGFEKLRRVSQAAVVQREALSVAQEQSDDATTQQEKPAAKKLSSLQKLFAAVSPRESVASLELSPSVELEPPKKHVVQAAEQVQVKEETAQQQEPRKRRSILVSHDEEGFEMTLVLPVNQALVEENEGAERRRSAFEDDGSATREALRQMFHAGVRRDPTQDGSQDTDKRKSTYLELLEQQRRQRTRTRTSSSATGAAQIPGKPARKKETSPRRTRAPARRPADKGEDSAKQSLLRLNAKLKLLNQRRQEAAATLTASAVSTAPPAAEPATENGTTQLDNGAHEETIKPTDAQPQLQLSVAESPTPPTTEERVSPLTSTGSPYRPSSPKFNAGEIAAIAADVRNQKTSAAALRVALRNPIFRILVATKLGSASNISRQLADMTYREQARIFEEIQTMVNRLSVEGLCDCLIQARQQLVDEELNRLKKLLYNKLEAIRPRLAVLSREELVMLAQQRVTLGALLQQLERALGSDQKYDSERHWAELLARQSLQRDAAVEARRKQLEEDLKLLFWEERATTTQDHEDTVEVLLGEIQEKRRSVVNWHARIHKQTEENAFAIAGQLGIDAHRLGETGAQRYLELYRRVTRALRRLGAHLTSAESETFSTS